MPLAGSVTAVIPTFNPDAAVVARVERLAPQVDRVLIVDDGSQKRAELALGRLIAMERVEVIRLRTNRGIAAALNAGVKAAVSGGAAAVLTLDQDSTVREGYVKAAMQALDVLRAAGHPVALVAAGVQSGRRVRPVRYADRGDRVTPTLEAIQSGLLIPVEVIRQIGMFDEGLFIDCVDTDFVLRAATAGIPTYLVRACVIEHALGRRIATRNLRVTRRGETEFSFHPPWRRYYISRNRAVVLFRHSTRQPAWAASGVAGELVQFLRSLVFGPQKGRQLGAAAAGIIDAAIGRRGKLPAATASLLGAPR